MGGFFTGEIIKMELWGSPGVSLSLNFPRWNKGPLITNPLAHSRQPGRSFPPLSPPQLSPQSL